MYITFTLPYPTGLSVNKYLIRTYNKVFLNPKIKEYYKQVYWLIYKLPKFKDSDINLYIKLYPPNRKKMDLDNCLKVVIDSLQNAEIFNNDNQIQRLTVERKEIIKYGKLDITIISLQT